MALLNHSGPLEGGYFNTACLSQLPMSKAENSVKIFTIECKNYTMGWRSLVSHISVQMKISNYCTSF